MKNILICSFLFFSMFLPAMAVNAQTSATTPAQYEEMKETLIYRQVMSYLGNLQRDNIEEYARSHSADQQAEIDVAALQQMVPFITNDFKILNKEDYLTTKFVPGAIYEVHVTTNDPAKTGVIVLEVVGKAEAPLVKVKEHLIVK